MTQNWNIPPAAGVVAGTYWKTDIPDAFATLRTLNAGTSAPTNTAALMLWADTNTTLLKQRNAADSAWVTIAPLNEDLGFHSTVIRIGSLAASVNIQLGAAKQKTWYVHRVRVLSDTATAASDGANNWGFQIVNVTQVNDLLAAILQTDATEITADTPYDVTADQNQTVAVDDLLELQITKTGAPTSPLAEVAVQFEYTTSIA